jgi:glycerol-3-phosphate dehydrogenase subunit B
MKVLVIGAGLAGVVAAARAAALGVEVSVVAHRPGATLMHGGGWAIGGPALLGQGLPVDRLDEVLGFVRDGLPELALQRGPFVLHDVEGARRACDLAPASHAAASGLPPSLANIDLLGLGHPFAEMQPVGSPLGVHWPEASAFGRSYASAAQRIEQDPAAMDALEAALVTAIAGRRFGGLVLPPVLGLTGVEARRARLSERLGMPVAEALDVLPSTPGLRLHLALQTWLARLDIPVRFARVTEVVAERGSVITEDGLTQSADGIILALGGRLTGALHSGCSVLGTLPVTPQLPVNLQEAVRRRGPYEGRLFRSGLPIDARMRPLDHHGGPHNRRLFACGDLLAGPDQLVSHTSSGRAVLSAYLAGEAAAKGVLR